MAEKIVVLDGHALNPGDLTWDALYTVGDVTVYDNTPAAEIVSRSKGASVLLTNKVPLRSETLAQLPELRLIAVLATGYDIIDLQAASDRGVVVSNIPTYGTNSVAQFAFAMLLELCHHVQRHSDDVRAGGWTKRNEWSYHLYPLIELADKAMGLIGFGRIGRQVGTLARAFGMKVIAADPLLENEPDVEKVSVEEVLRRSDVVSLHCPLTPETRNLINAERLRLMKPSAFLLNTSRGPLIVEQDLADALNAQHIAGAAVDVLPVEPPKDSPLFSARNCIVTPHLAWATREARARLMDIAVENVRGFLSGNPQNVVNRAPSLS
jgi:glycerate dehydrogenase